METIMKKIIALAAFSALLLSSEAYAATVDSVIMSDVDRSVLTVSGTVGSDDDMGVSVTVLKKGDELAPGMLYSDGASIQKAQITEDGRFEASFRFSPDEGVYEVYVSGSDKAYEFTYVSKSGVMQLVDKLGSRKIPENSVYAELELCAESMGVDLSVADSDPKKQYLAKNIINYSDEINKNGVDGVRAVVLRTKAELEFVYALRNTSAAPNVNALLVSFADPAKIDISEYKLLSDSMKTKVCIGFVGANYNDIKDFKSDFESALISAKNASSQTSGGGGGGGSSSGGGGGSSGGISAGNNRPPVIVSDSSGFAGIHKDSQQDESGRVILDAFDDLNEAKWAWDYILFVVDRNIMNGVDDNKFDPNGTLTREQFAKIITLAFGMYDETLVPDYDDVKTDDWSAAYIASAKASGLMLGTGENIFGYGEPISRQDLCVTIYRAAQKSGIEFENKNTDFTDFEDISEYAKEAVSFMAGDKIVSGMDDGSFCPQQYATRAQAAKIIAEVIGMGER